MDDGHAYYIFARRLTYRKLDIDSFGKISKVGGQRKWNRDAFFVLRLF